MQSTIHGTMALHTNKFVANKYAFVHDVYNTYTYVHSVKVADISSQSLIRYKQLQFVMSVIRHYKGEIHFENDLLKTTNNISVNISNSNSISNSNGNINGNNKRCLTFYMK